MTPGLATLIRACAVLAVVGVSTLATACSPSIASYVRARDAWTEEETIYEDFESRIFVEATLKTETFRTEYVKEYGRIFALPEAQQQTLLDAQLAEHGEHHVVMASIFVARVVWDDFRPEKGIWGVRLENEAGDAVAPTLVQRHRTDNPTWQALYPYIGEHDTFYEFRFPRTVDTDDGPKPLAKAGQPLYLVIAGAPGKVRLSWVWP